MVKASKRQQEERRKARKVNRAGLSLTDKVLSPTLHGRYAIAAGRILTFWEHSNLTPQRWEDVDLAASQYLEHVFAEGYPKGYGSDGLDLQHFNIFCLRPLGNSGTAGDSLNHGKRWNLHCVSCQSTR